MEAVGHVAGAIAHDFNNMLNVMQLHASIALRAARTDLAPDVEHAHERSLIVEFGDQLEVDQDLLAAELELELRFDRADGLDRLEQVSAEREEPGRGADQYEEIAGALYE